MATRTLEKPRKSRFNLRIYDSDGSLLAVLGVPEDPAARYIKPGMLYRYCAWIFIVPENARWAIYHLSQDGSTTQGKLREEGRTWVSPGNYIVLSPSGSPIQVNLTDQRAPRRVITQSKSTGAEKNTLQGRFRDALRKRDNACAITGLKKQFESEKPYRVLSSAHIFPASRLSDWERGNYQRFIEDTSPASVIGESKLFSPQNGLLLRYDIHLEFDDFVIGVDPDDDYKIIYFEADQYGIGGRCLSKSATHPPNPTQRASPDLLRWHLMQCVFKNMKANVEPEEIWEHDLGSDDIGQILEQPDAGERMEVELFTRLGGLVA